jgi:hypothetical protein
MDFGDKETFARLTAAAAGELERILELFEDPVRIPGTGMAEAPIIGNVYFEQLGHAHLLPPIFRAVRAEKIFRQEAPGWPELPLRQEDCERLEHNDDPQLAALGLFGSSLRSEQWDVRHPGFRAFVSGLMAYEHTPREIRNDPDLQQLFPPRRLEGLCDGKLNWRSPEVRAMDRRVEEIVAEYEARTGLRRAASTTAPARWTV